MHSAPCIEGALVPSAVPVAPNLSMVQRHIQVLNLIEAMPYKLSFGRGTLPHLPLPKFAGVCRQRGRSMRHLGAVPVHQELTLQPRVQVPWQVAHRSPMHPPDVPQHLELLPTPCNVLKGLLVHYMLCLRAVSHRRYCRRQFPWSLQLAPECCLQRCCWGPWKQPHAFIRLSRSRPTHCKCMPEDEEMQRALHPAGTT